LNALVAEQFKKNTSQRPPSRTVQETRLNAPVAGQFKRHTPERPPS